MWYPAAQIAVAALVLWYLVRSVAANWADIRRSGDALNLSAAPLVLAAVIVLATFAMLIAAWRTVLLGWGERLGYGHAARIWCLSNLARYVPGRVWQIAGMAAMARRAGVSPWAAAGSAVVVQLLAIATGALVTGVAAPRAGQPLLIAATGVASTIIAGSLAWPPATRWLAGAVRRLTGREYSLEPVALRPLLLSAGVTSLAWVTYGLALFFFARGILGGPSLALIDAVGAFTASYLVGLLLVFSPGGLVVREGALYMLLLGPLGPRAAFLITVGSRVLLTATELLAALIVLVLPKRLAEGPADHG